MSKTSTRRGGCYPYRRVPVSTTVSEMGNFTCTSLVLNLCLTIVYASCTPVCAWLLAFADYIVTYSHYTPSWQLHHIALRCIICYLLHHCTALVASFVTCWLFVRYLLTDCTLDVPASIAIVRWLCASCAMAVSRLFTGSAGFCV